MNDWAVLLLVYAVVFISNPVIAILHELGHAFAYLIFTKPDRVDIYIGSYGGATKYITFNIGKLHFFLKRSFPFVKGIGLCASYKQETNYLNHIYILLAGPFFTFFTLLLFGIIMLNTEPNLYYKIACYLFIALSSLSLIVNLIPKDINDSFYGVANTADNMENDGKQILFDLKIKKLRPYYVEAFECIKNKDYDGATEKLKKVLMTVPDSQKILRLIIKCSLAIKETNVAAFYVAELEHKFELSTNDLLQKGYLQSILLNHDDAISIYSRVLKRDRNNIIALNNIGYELIEMGAHQVAKRALDRAIKLKPKFDHPYNNLGYSKILQGEMEDGKTLVDKCLKLNVNNAEAYKTLGIYYLKQKDWELANKNFNRAIELDDKIELGTYVNELKLLEEQHA